MAKAVPLGKWMRLRRPLLPAPKYGDHSFDKTNPFRGSIVASVRPEPVSAPEITPSILRFAPIQGIEGKDDLADLAPKDGFIPAEEREVGQIGNSSLTLRLSARSCADRRWWASEGCRPQTRHAWAATNLRCSLSRMRRGSLIVRTLLSMPTTEAAPRVAGAKRGMLRRHPGIRRRVSGRHFWGDHWRLFGASAGKASVRLRPPLDGRPEPVSRPPIAEGREPSRRSLPRQIGIGGRQRVFGGQAPTRPAGRLVGGLKGVEFGHQPIPQRRRLARG
jgi:hypothetical protein